MASPRFGAPFLSRSKKATGSPLTSRTVCHAAGISPMSCRRAQGIEAALTRPSSTHVAQTWRSSNTVSHSEHAKLPQ